MIQHPLKEQGKPGGDTGGQSPPMTDEGGQGPSMSPVRTEAHNITSKEAEGLFAEAGVPRSKRSVERYCAKGRLDCFLDPDEGQYYITEGSIRTLAAELKQIESRHQRPDAMTPPGAPPSDKGGSTAANGGQGPAGASTSLARRQRER